VFVVIVAHREAEVPSVPKVIEAIRDSLVRQGQKGTVDFRVYQDQSDHLAFLAHRVILGYRDLPVYKAQQ
jgi:hypothetical protein